MSIFFSCSEEYRHSTQPLPTSAFDLSGMEDQFIENLPENGQLSITGPPKRDGTPTPPYRPAYGTKGSDVTLKTNYFHLNFETELYLHHYSMVVYPPTDPKVQHNDTEEPNSIVGKKLTQLIRIMLEEPRFARFRNDLVMDFAATLISREAIPEDLLETPI